MYHEHLADCDSTQLYLKNNISHFLQKDPNILISTSNQSQGIGRHGNHWGHYKNSLAFSFTYHSQIPITQVPLLVGIQLTQFINKKFDQTLRLKWPNDILNSNFEKCAGILCQYHSPEIVLVGIGINLGSASSKFLSENYRTKHGIICENLQFQNDEQKKIPQEIYQYFLDNKSCPPDIKHLWESLCIHMNRPVVIHGPSLREQGTFTGIDQEGHAILQLENNKTKKLISGSLDIL